MISRGHDGRLCTVQDHHRKRSLDLMYDDKSHTLVDQTFDIIIIPVCQSVTTNHPVGIKR